VVVVAAEAVVAVVATKKIALMAHVAAKAKAAVVVDANQFIAD
jgi:hypothetical protein